MNSNTTEFFLLFPSTSTTPNYINLTLNNDTINSQQNIDQINVSSSLPLSHHYARRDKVVFFEMHFEEHQTQLTFAFWFFITILAKIVFHRLERIKGVLPDSALLLVLGSVFGGILHFVFPEQASLLELQQKIYFIKV
ncbi:unnamed protein product [Meloidogyne enterolobii]|uniref:Uncharacterized protein n=2 Tax=Meloidogyne enterolobii TaxID=390850 RepID=A0ACB0XXF3_MELEN|nr:unnamed protein product [Meloidogyne enterolobii]